MKITENNEFNLSEITLIPIDGKFYFKVVKDNTIIKEVTEEQFKIMLVTANNAKNSNSNTFDYLIDQLEMNEDLFTAILYPKWII